MTSKKVRPPDLQLVLAAILACLDGQEWTPDTLDRIAAILEAAGYTIREPQ